MVCILGGKYEKIFDSDGGSAAADDRGELRLANKDPLAVRGECCAVCGSIRRNEILQGQSNSNSYPCRCFWRGVLWAGIIKRR